MTPRLTVPPGALSTAGMLARLEARGFRTPGAPIPREPPAWITVPPPRPPKPMRQQPAPERD